MTTKPPRRTRSRAGHRGRDARIAERQCQVSESLSAELRNVAQVIQCAAAWLRNQQPLSTMGEETADELESSVQRLVDVADTLRDCARVEVPAELEQLVAEQFPGCHLEVSPP